MRSTNAVIAMWVVAPVAFAIWMVASVAFAESDGPHHDHSAMNDADAAPSSAAAIASPSSESAPIRITINPEARVSVVMSGAIPPAVQCGTALDIAVDVVNQGFVTAPLEATLVGNAPAGVTVSLDPAPLKGAPSEMRMLRVTLTQPGQTDLAVAFRARNEIPDIGGRDRVHFLVECRKRDG